MPPINRRELLKHTGGAIAVAPLVNSHIARGARGEEERLRDGDHYFEPESEFFGTASIQYGNSYHTDSGGDLWPACWADDDNLYAANGDGVGFGNQYEDIVMNRISGTPETGLSGEAIAYSDEFAEVWSEDSSDDPVEFGTYSPKPTGMVAVDSDGDGQDELYVAYQDLRRPVGDAPRRNPNGVPNASISKSEDYGETWEKTDEPMFTDYRFTTIMFLDYGQSYENVEVLGDEAAEYVYAYGLDYNWRNYWTMGDPEADARYRIPNPTNLYLARVPKESILDRSAWEFYAGTDSNGKAGGRANGEPTWNTDIEQREPVLTDVRQLYQSLICDFPNQTNVAEDTTVLSQGSVVYNEPLDRYIYTSWTRYTFEFYEAPEPWGPWNLFTRKDFGASRWRGRPNTDDCPGLKEGGYAATIPSKFISDDGKTMWVQSDTNGRYFYNCGSPDYQFSLRKLEVEPFTDTAAENEPDPEANLATADGTTPHVKTANHGYTEYLNDGKKEQNESSYDCSNKALDFWGYTWPRKYTLDRVEYTTGDMKFDGGWFKDDLRVQVRQDFEWIDVDGLSISPEYPYDDSAGTNQRYTFTFDDTWGDGVRIIGRPGGDASFTTVSELEVYYESDDHPGRGPPEDSPGRGPPDDDDTPGRGPPDDDDTPGRGPPDDDDTPGRGPPEDTPGRGPSEDTKPPSRVTGLVAESGIETVQLSWDPAEDNYEVATYEIYASQGNNVKIDAENLLGVVPFTVIEFTHENLDMGETWQYRVRATDTSGNAGPTSKRVSATTIVDDEPPSAVTGLTAEGDIEAVQLSWESAEDNYGVETYEVYGSRDSSFEVSDDTLIGTETTPEIETEYTHGSLGPDETWHYKVRAIDVGGNPGPLEEASATTRPIDRIEGESLLSTAEYTNGRVKVTDMDKPFFSHDSWSNDAQFVYIPGASEGSVTITFDAPKSGEYELSAVYSRGFDYGNHVASIDGESTNETFHGYNSRPNAIMQADPVSYGNYDLDAGEHTFTLTVTGKDSESVGYRLGLDYLDLRLLD